MRKVIQLIDSDNFMWALCDDGTMWGIRDNKWIRCPDIPQEGDVFTSMGDR